MYRLLKCYVFRKHCDVHFDGVCPYTGWTQVFHFKCCFCGTVKCRSCRAQKNAEKRIHKERVKAARRKHGKYLDG